MSTKDKTAKFDLAEELLIDEDINLSSPMDIRNVEEEVPMDPPSLPFKCLCLGDHKKDPSLVSRSRGNISEDTCSCPEEEGVEKVTRVVCCHAHGAGAEYNRVIKVS